MNRKNVKGFSAGVALLLPALALADAPQTVYVRPAGENTPAEPYASWETAANDIRTAANGVAAGGIVKIASGDYSANTGGLAGHQATVFEAVDPANDAPGAVTVGYMLLDHVGDCPAPDANRLTLRKGVFTMHRPSDQIYLDVGSGTSKAASNTVVVTGAGTKLVTTGRSLNIGYYMKGSCLRFTDHAVGELGPIFVSKNEEDSVGATLIVEDGACVTNSSGGQAYFGYNGSEAHVVVSNGELVLRGQTLLGSSTKHDTTLYVGGATPSVDCSSQLKFLGDSVTTVDMAEAPLEGYAKPPIKINQIFYRSTCTFNVAGLDVLEQRLAHAPIARSRWTILQATNIGDGDATRLPLQELVENLQAWFRANHPNFTFERTGTCTFVVSWNRPAVFVVPEGTDGVVPTPPYDTWATASTNISQAADYVGDNGLVTILEGTYPESRYTKNYPVRYRIVKDTDDPTPGTAILNATMMGYGTKAWSTGWDRTGYFTSGTFHLNPAASGNAFLEHNGDGWGTDSRTHWVATGPDTVIDAAGKIVYVGYTARSAVFELLDGAQIRSSGAEISSGGNIINALYVIGDGAVHTNAGYSYICTASDRVTALTMVISNGTFVTSTSSIDNNTQPNDTKIQFKGAKPLFRAGGNVNLRGDAEITFDLSEAAFEGYKAFDVASVNDFSDDVTFVVDGVAELKARLAAAGVSAARLTLVSSRNGTLPDALKTKLAAVTLPGGCVIRFRGGDAVLCIGNNGLMMVFR